MWLSPCCVESETLSCSLSVSLRTVSGNKVFNYIFRNRNEWSHLHGNSLTWGSLVGSPPTWHVAGNPGVRPLDWRQGTPLRRRIDLQIAPDTFHHFVVPPTPQKRVLALPLTPSSGCFHVVCVCGVGGGVIECRRLFSTARLARHTSTIAVFVVLRVKRNCVYCENPRAPSSEERSLHQIE